MKVKIINGYKPFWYNDKVGQVFSVIVCNDIFYELIDNSNLLIFKCDCIDIKKLREEKNEKNIKFGYIKNILYLCNLINLIIYAYS